MTSAFDKLARPVQKWIRAQDWRELREIQALAIHFLAEDKGDLIIAASTAGGKTEAAFLPLISQVLDDSAAGSGFDLLYIGPLKALISDQARRLEDICREAELPVVPWHGDIAASSKSRAIKNPRGILLITPESLEALFVRRGLEVPRLFKNARAVVIDELHSLLDTERGIQVRSLLARLELAVGRPIRRIGLSATLGDMALTRQYLRPAAPDDVHVIKVDKGGSELQIQLRGYVSGDKDEDVPAPVRAISDHLFTHLRGSDNLVFAGTRQSVEIYADRLRTLCEEAHLPQEFYPHHANLSREHREFVERRLKEGKLPTTAICTSTLELGIDIGDVTCVAQIGAPFSVASLRQRLGRSGRREGKPAILRQYAIETGLRADSNVLDGLRLGLVRAVAMIELLLEGWCEPPQPGALHLSTLVHQILSVISGWGGAKATDIYKTLCQHGPFRSVSAAMLLDVLRAIGRPSIALIEQGEEGILLLGEAGEKLTDHYSFFAVFETPEEYRIVANGKTLGSISIDNILAPGMQLIFSGRRWHVQEIHDLERVVVVTPTKAGVPPRFSGDPGIIHDRVIERMFELLESQERPGYMDRTALELLDEARGNYAQIRFDTGGIVQAADSEFLIATRLGTIKSETLALALRSQGCRVHVHDGFIEGTFSEAQSTPADTLKAIARGENIDLFSSDPNLISEKFHPYLTDDLLRLDIASSKLNAESLPRICKKILEA
ncbi:MAG: DEAD/DEAH box helicase [Pseudomonadota bacterium]